MPPPAELAPAPEPSVATAMASQTLRGWGGGPGVSAMLTRPADADAVANVVREACARARGHATIAGAIPRGMGRSYGDAAQLTGGLVLDVTGLKGWQLDAQSGTVTAGAGVTIGELLDQLVPAGWMLPVVPGTQHVTVGGAIASDVHGKNHATAGTFGSHVPGLGLLTASGEIIELTADSHDERFWATMGGMGLTGVIVWAQIRLQPVGGPLLSVDTDRASNLDQALSLLSQPAGSYRIAWLDLLGRHPGRGVVTRADHVDASRGGAGAGLDGRRVGRLAERRPAAATVRSRATVPSWWPAGVLRASTVGAFNELRFRRAPRRERGRLGSLGTEMFPLDALRAWPRLYGGSGLLQYQFVVPHGHERVLEQVIEQVRRARVPCFLATLKDLGAANDAPLSFPLPGWTLALDLPRAAPGIEALLDGCDQRVARAGGRVYLTKDARMRSAATRAMYPRLAAWRAARARVDPEGLWRSDLALRTGLISADDR